jgi:hypothetical protein
VRAVAVANAAVFEAGTVEKAIELVKDLRIAAADAGRPDQVALAMRALSVLHFAANPGRLAYPATSAVLERLAGATATGVGAVRQQA